MWTIYRFKVTVNCELRTKFQLAKKYTHPEYPVTPVRSAFEPLPEPRTARLNAVRHLTPCALCSQIDAHLSVGSHCRVAQLSAILWTSLKLIVVGNWLASSPGSNFSRKISTTDARRIRYVMAGLLWWSTRLQLLLFYMERQSGQKLWSAKVDKNDVFYILPV